VTVKEPSTFLREAAQLWSYTWVLHFTMYNGDVFQVWWTGSQRVMWNFFFRFLCTRNYSNWL